MESERRLHPLSFVFALGDSAKQLLLPAVLALFASRRGGEWEVLAAVIIVPLALVALVRTLSVRYRFAENELVIRSGIIFRGVRHIPYERIQNVDAVQNVLHRALGVVEVRVETGGGSETEGVLRVVGAPALEEIRAHVFARRRVRASAADAAVVARTLLKMSAGEVALFGLVHGSGMIVAGAAFGLLAETGLLERATGAAFGEWGGRGVVRQVLSAVFAGGPLPVRQMAIAAVVLVALVLAFKLVSIVWMVTRYHGFLLTRSGDDLRCEYGLFTLVTKTIPLRRIQKVSVREGPWHRLGERVSLRVQTAGGTAADRTADATVWLAPLLRRRALPALLAEIAPEAAAEVDWQPVHPRGVRREFAGTLAVLVPVAGALAWAMGVLGLLLLLPALAWAALHARRTVAALGWGVSATAIHFRSGWIWRRHVIAPLEKIQVVARRQSPLDRRHEMARVCADTAGRGIDSYRIDVPYLPAPVAETLAAQLSAATARTGFRW